MQKHGLHWLLAVTLLTIQPCHSQAIMEFGGVNASSVGLGAGLGLSLSHGMALTHSYQAAASAQAAIIDKSRAIEQYMKMGYDYEARKDLDSAEKAYRYALQVIASRDGPGSPKSVPALQHLVSIASMQQRWNDALNMQKTVVKFSQQNPNDVSGAVREQINLSKLFIQTNNLPQAEVNLRETITLCDSHPSVPAAQRDAALSQYAQVLKQMDNQSTPTAAQSTVIKPPSNVEETTASLDAAIDSTVKKTHHKRADQTDEAKGDDATMSTKSEETPKIPDASEVLGSEKR